MTPEEFRGRLRALGLSIRGFCAHTGTAPSTATYWGIERAGHISPFPGWVACLLDAWDRAPPTS